MANIKVDSTTNKTIPIGADKIYLIDSVGASDAYCTLTQLFTGGTAWTIGKTAVATTIAGTAVVAEGLTVTAGGVTVSDGQTALTDNSNAAAGFIFQNDTITTFGTAEDEGAFIISSDSLTSGTLFKLQLDESALNGGYFLTCYQTDAGAIKFSIGENGATVIAGAAAATAALTLTAGDLVLTSGHGVLTAGNLTLTLGNLTLTNGATSLTRASNAVALTVTNNSATSASVAVFAGSGTFTGTTTTSWMTITPSGLTTGTGVYLPLAALTQGRGLHITSGATQTTGSLLYVQDTGANCAMTSGTIASFDETATAITSSVNRISSSVSITSSRTVTTGTVSDNFDLCSIVRTAIINGAGSFAKAGSVLYIQNVTTNTSGTITDTVNGIEIVMDVDGTGDGISITHNAVAGKGLNITSAATTAAGVILATANALTQGQIVKIASSATAITGNGRMFLSSHSGATGTSATLNEFSSAATDETVILQVTASAALALGTAFKVSAASATTSTVVSMDGLDALTSGTALSITSNSADATARTLVLIKNDHASATGAVGLTIQQDGDVAALAITGLTTVGIDFTALGVADSLFNCTATTDVVGKSPDTEEETGFIKIDVAGAARYIPFYAAA